MSSASDRPTFRAFLQSHSRLRRLARFAFRISNTADTYVHAVVPNTIWRSLGAYPRFFMDRRRYKRESGEDLHWYHDNPQLLDRRDTTPFDRHYTYQDGWAAREICSRRPPMHVDVGSRISFVVGLAAFVPVTFIDLRPLEITFPGLETMRGSILDLPYEDASVASISSLHVAEHIGLGRYGDPLDPEGTVRAAIELERVVAPNGFLYFSVPVGRPHVAFNAHRVLDPRAVCGLFPNLVLDGFAGVDDAGGFHLELTPSDLVDSGWGCGLYRFTRPG